MAFVTKKRAMRTQRELFTEKEVYTNANWINAHNADSHYEVRIQVAGRP
jgi:hypothetical protein